VKFIVKRIPGAAPAGSERITSLDDELINDPMEQYVVVQRVPGNGIAGCRIRPFSLPRR
jgi:hypothetical protein